MTRYDVTVSNWIADYCVTDGHAFSTCIIRVSSNFDF